MCGIAGFLNSSPKRTQKELRAVVSAMADTLVEGQRKSPLRVKRIPHLGPG